MPGNSTATLAILYTFYCRQWRVIEDEVPRNLRAPDHPAFDAVRLPHLGRRVVDPDPPAGRGRNDATFRVGANGADSRRTWFQRWLRRRGARGRRWYFS